MGSVKTRAVSRTSEQSTENFFTGRGKENTPWLGLVKEKNLPADGKGIQYTGTTKEDLKKNVETSEVRWLGFLL